MSSTLFIRLGPMPEQDVSWLITGPEGDVIESEQRGSLSAAAGYAAGNDVIILLPGMQTVMTTADIPVRGASRQLQVAPFALEDQLAEDIGQMHFAVGPRREDGKVPVAAISLSIFKAWMDSLHEHEIEPSAIYSELQGLPDIPGAISVIIEPKKAMLRLPGGECLAVDPDMLDTMLTSATKEKAPVKGVDAPADKIALLIYLDNALADQGKLWVERIRARFPDAEFRQMANGSLPQMAACLHGKGLINFLQGDFAPKSDWQRAVKPWRLPAMLAAALVLVVALVQAASLWRLSRVEEQLDAALEASLQQVFPGQTRINDPRRQLDQLQRSLRGGGSGSSSQFLDTVVALGAVLPTLGETRVEAASYRNQLLDLRVKVPDVTTLDQLQKRMQENGRFQVTIQSANPRADGVEGRIEIARGGS